MPHDVRIRSSVLRRHFARGARSGVAATLTPSERKTSSKPARCRRRRGDQDSADLIDPAAPSGVKLGLCRCPLQHTRRPHCAPQTRFDAGARRRPAARMKLRDGRRAAADGQIAALRPVEELRDRLNRLLEHFQCANEITLDAERMARVLENQRPVTCSTQLCQMIGVVLWVACAHHN
jgi:hypothetical protein